MMYKIYGDGDGDNDNVHDNDDDYCERDDDDVENIESRLQADLKFVGTVGTGGPVKFFLAV